MSDPGDPVRLPARGDRVVVLIVDDSIDHTALMRMRLEREGFTVLTAGDGAQARPRFDEADIVLLDYKLPDATGLELLAEAQRRELPPSVVLVTALGSTDVAVEAMRDGAVDYVTKEHGYLDVLPDVVRRAWRQHDLRLRAAQLQRLALLVTSTVDRESLLHEVVAGAQRLLRASTCALLLADEHGDLQPAMVLGAPADLAALAAVDVEWHRDEDRPVADEDRLLVPLPRDGGPPLGLLVVWRGDGIAPPEEQELAQAFAAFAGIALRNLRQRELEQDLVFELRQTVAARKDFVASISHELRTPLTCIAGFATTLRERREALTEELVDDLLGRVERNADDLLGLVEDLIDVAALDRGSAANVEPAALRAAEHVRTTVADAAQLLGDRVVSVDVPDVRVWADAGHLRRTLVNLLTNAAKFSPDDSPVAVRAHVVEGMLRIEVEDHGMGMDPRTARRVFDPFFRAETSVVNAIRGSGIGLSLVREYVRTMGGSVGVRSRLGEGATFWFTVPLVPVDHQPATTDGASGVVQPEVPVER